MTDDMKDKIEKSTFVDPDPVIQKIKETLRQYPTKPMVGCGGVVKFDGKLLLIQRAAEPDRFKYAIPGGHLDLGESCAHCAERETFEETGIKTKARKLAGVIDKIMYDDDNKILYHYVLINYYLDIVDERFENGIPYLEPMSDVKDIQFVPFNEIKNYDITDSLRELLLNIGILKIQ